MAAVMGQYWYSNLSGRDTALGDYIKAEGCSAPDGTPSCHIHHFVTVNDLPMILGNEGKIHVEWAAEEVYFDTLDDNLHKNNMWLCARSFLDEKNRVQRTEYELQIMKDRFHNSASPTTDGMLCYNAYTDERSICDLLKSKNVAQWDPEKQDPAEAQLYPIAALLTNRIGVDGHSGFYIDACTVMAGEHAGKKVVVGCLSNATEFKASFSDEESPIMSPSPSKLGLFLNGSFEDPGSFQNIDQCAGMVRVQDLQNWADDYD